MNTNKDWVQAGTSLDGDGFLRACSGGLQSWRVSSSSPFVSLRVHSWMKKSSSAAFSLIELLVVVAILAVLAAILLPVFAQARAMARTTACLSNQRQLGVAMRLYVEDNDGTYPWNLGPRFTPSVIADTLLRE